MVKITIRPNRPPIGEWLRRCRHWSVRNLSLKTLLRFWIISLVTILVTLQSVATLRVTAEGSFQDALERSQSIAMQVSSMLIDRLNQEEMRAFPLPASPEESKALWTSFLENDPSISALLEKLMASSSVAMEVQVCDEFGRILTSSSSSRPRVTYRSLPDFEDWNVRTLWDRLYEVLTQRKEYSMVVPLGVLQAERPLFTIRIIVSSVLLRDAVVPQIRSLAYTSLAVFLAAIMLAVVFSNVVLRSLDRLGKRIDLITAGDFTPEATQPQRESREIAAVSSKLNLLSEQFRGAKEDAMQLRENIDQLLRGLEAAVMMFDPDHRLVLAGRQAEIFLARNRERMIGCSMEELFPRSTALGAAIREAVDQKRPCRERASLLERSGAPPVRLLVSVELLENFPGLHRLGTLVTLRDVESRRQLQSQLDVSTRLTAISRLTGGVAHEIKNPLNAIALHLEVLKAKLSEPSEVGTELGVIEREIARLDRVVKTFLDFTRPVELQMREIDLAGLLSEVAELVGPEVEHAEVEIEFQADVGSAPIRGDRDLLKQAILNVVVNGIEAMSDGGRLRIGIQRQDGDYVVTVADEGVGIPAEVRERIFNLYFTTKEEGTGIGLAMTFRVVHLHNATIDFASETGRGTTFHLRFPPSDESATPEAASSASPAPRETSQHS